MVTFKGLGELIHFFDVGSGDISEFQGPWDSRGGAWQAALNEFSIAAGYGKNTHAALKAAVQVRENVWRLQKKGLDNYVVQLRAKLCDTNPSENLYKPHFHVEEFLIKNKKGIGARNIHFMYKDD